MSQMRYKETKKKPSAVIITVAVLVILAIASAVIIYFLTDYGKQQQHSGKTEPSSAVASAETAAQQSTQQITASSQQNAYSSGQQAQEREAPDNTENTKIVVPADSNTDANFFKGEFSPYKAVDADTNSECSLKEVFGSSFSGGSIMFNLDGSFSDTLSISSVNSGAYILNNSTITATYTNDKNVTIAVIEWNGDTPSRLIINYGGYDVYFN